MVVTPKNVPTQISVTVGASNTEILNEPGVSPRIDIVLTNTSTGGQVISLGFGIPAVAGLGIILYPQDTYVFSRAQNYDPPQNTINGIASAAGGTIAVFARSA